MMLEIKTEAASREGGGRKSQRKGEKFLVWWICFIACWGYCLYKHIHYQDSSSHRNTEIQINRAGGEEGGVSESLKNKKTQRRLQGGAIFSFPQDGDSKGEQHQGILQTY